MMNKHYILQAITADGKSAYIDDVPNGKNCGCICAECKGKLIAKNNGRIKTHHFAHESGNDNIKCSQTALHLLAKEIIAEEKRIPVPRNGKIEFYKADVVEQEKYLGDIIPDLYATCEGRNFIVEILVTHEVDEVKRKKIANRRISAAEIDLSDKIFESKEEVKSALFNSQNIRIVYDDDEKLISERKEILLNFGLQIHIQRGGVIECPYAKNFVKANFCKECVLCYSENNDLIFCGSVLPILIKPALRTETKIICNQNTVMFPSEAKKYNESHFGWKMREAVQHAHMSLMIQSKMW